MLIHWYVIWLAVIKYYQVFIDVNLSLFVGDAASKSRGSQTPKNGEQEEGDPHVEGYSDSTT